MQRLVLLGALFGAVTLGALLMTAVSAFVSPGIGHPGYARFEPASRARQASRMNAPDNVDRFASMNMADAILAPVHAIALPEPWLADAASLAAYATSRIAALAEARDAALSAFGPDAAAHAALQPLFYPLAERLPGLSSAAQIAVYEAELKALGTAHLGDGADGFASLMGAIETSAGAAAAYEYALQRSPVAGQLRSSGIALDENEYRRSFDALSTLALAKLLPEQYLAARRELRATLGPVRFATLWSQRDPRYAELRRLAERYELGTEKIDSAYIVLNDMQDALVQHTLSEGAPTPRADAADPSGERLAELYAAQKRRLADVVGAQAADGILRDLAIWASTNSR